MLIDEYGNVVQIPFYSTNESSALVPESYIYFVLYNLIF